MQEDLVYQEQCGWQSPRWWFINEAGLEEGPYDTEHLARIALVEYCYFCLDGGPCLYRLPANWAQIFSKWEEEEKMKS